VKIVPGYIQSRWTAPTGIKVGDNPNANIGDVIWNAMRGPVNIADYVKQLNKIANEQYQNAVKKIAIMTK
ncbi:MAG TPA: ABC transporter substrate-binding protein, partial [Fervidobacterium nodosum]|nr:ABC transporter substrate-binding protein [Fervidobacterium nodosum]